MKAAVYSSYGPPDMVRITDVPPPVPQDNEVLIRVHASTVSSGDARLRSMNLPRGFGLIGRLIFGITGPRQPILGTELSGSVTAIGAEVTRFAAGDAVIAFPGAKMRAHAEYRTMTQDGAIVRKPANLTFAQGASLAFGGTTALHFLRDKGHIKPGDKLLVLGGSGCVGSAAIQIGRAFGAHVTATTSARNAGLVRSLGAERVIDYTAQDFTAEDIGYDLILDTAGATTFARAIPCLRPGGRLLMVLSDLPQTLAALRKGPKGKRAIGGPAPERPADLAFLVDLAAKGEVLPFIDRVYPFDQIAAAHAHVDGGHKRGSVVVSLVD